MQGSFSHSLAEYTLAACNWFAKDFPRLRAQQKARKWEPFNVEERRKRTMGVVGYGDIGQAAARIARAFGMRIIALRRNPELSDQEKQDCLTVRAAPVTTATAPAYHICMQGYHQEGFTCKACPARKLWQMHFPMCSSALPFISMEAICCYVTSERLMCAF